MFKLEIPLKKSDSLYQIQSPQFISRLKKVFLGMLSLVLLFSMTATTVQGAPSAENVLSPEVDPVNFLIDRVDSAKYYHWMSSRSLRLDSNKRPHIVYGGDALYYWYNDGTMWRYETIDPAPGVGKYASLALDSSNRPHVSYYNATNGSLRYARKISGSWEIFTLDQGPADTLMTFNQDTEFGEAGPDAIESNAENRDWRYTLPGSGNPYEGDYELEPNVGDVIEGEPYLGEGLPAEVEAQLSAESQESTYAPTSLDDTGRGLFTSIVINSFGNPSISYYDSFNGDLKYASFNGSVWDIRTVDSAGNVGQYSSLALDSSSYPYISYYDADKGDLKFVRFTGTAWTTPVVLDSGGDSATVLNYVGLHTSIAVDSSKNVHISYYDATQGNLKYGRTSSGSWSFFIVDSAGDVGLYTSLAVDSAGKAYISYYHATNADLKYAVCSGGACGVQNIYTSGFAGLYTSIALDGTSPYISFYDSGTGQLRLAQVSGASWIFHIIDTSGDVGLFTSIAFDNSGRPAIAYMDDLRDDLKYASWNGFSWGKWTIDTVGEVGLYTSLAFNKTNNYPGISYYDATRKSLKYANWTGTAWAITELDTGDAGTFSSLAYDSTGKPRIAYCKGKGCLTRVSTDPVELRMIMWSGTSWVYKTIDSPGVGSYLSMKLGTDNQIHISYYDVNLRQLKYVRGAADGSSWVKQVADASEKVGLFTSLSLDNLNRPHISYFEDYLDRLKYAYWNGSSWVHEIVDANSPTGFYTSIAVSSTNVPHISYYDLGRRQLKYAYRAGANSWVTQVVDDKGEVGQFSSIVLRGGTFPTISYYDATNGDLKIAWDIVPIEMPYRLYLPLIRR